MKKAIILSAFLLIVLTGCKNANNSNNKSEENNINNLSIENMTTEEKSISTSTLVGDVKENMKIVMKTSKGNIELELYKDKTPITVDNFLKNPSLINFKNIKFHRVLGSPV